MNGETPTNGGSGQETKATQQAPVLDYGKGEKPKPIEWTNLFAAHFIVSFVMAYAFAAYETANGSGRLEVVWECLLAPVLLPLVAILIAFNGFTGSLQPVHLVTGCIIYLMLLAPIFVWIRRIRIRRALKRKM